MEQMTGQELREIRKKWNYSQKDFCRLIWLYSSSGAPAISTLSLYENNKVKIPFPVQRLAIMANTVPDRWVLEPLSL